MKPRAGRFSAPRQSRRVIAKRIGRRKNARILYARGVGGRLGTIPEPTGRSPPSDPAVPPRGVRGLVTVGRPELRRRRRQVVADGAGGEVGARGDLLDGGAVRGELEHVGLARRAARGGRRPRLARARRPRAGGGAPPPPRSLGRRAAGRRTGRRRAPGARRRRARAPSPSGAGPRARPPRARA